VRYRLVGIHSNDAGSPDYPIPGDGGLGSFFISNETSTWKLPNATLILALGHLHIGAVNISLWDAGTEKMIMSSKPVYDENNFIVHITRSSPLYRFITGNKYTVVAVYDNSRAYEAVMGLVQLWLTDEKQ